MVPLLVNNGYTVALVIKLQNRLTSKHVDAIKFFHMSEDMLQIGLSVSIFGAFFF